MEKPYWEGKEFSFFSHKKCEYFPCHKGADPEEFNCLFCYCPLYALGKDCGGNFTYIKIVQTVLYLISVKIMDTLQENIRSLQSVLQEWIKMKEMRSNSPIIQKRLFA